ncbi:hypothetical protein TVAG_246020 [Trichomonas vaginalis G3]|uniref:Uncharacterized protein n=1 Tax=Trichomonas vaginalis (strain ATCC PRA-98 / G3) TaxID=412133 RepID=A2E4R0_TRIV3|nr:hypothetical protein TVAGG3_0862630 [Trichomonas vaginalis G3]EAY12370.1 hypothetical protein TVAG_246020 [Trichomonas vaginalis G3]KAI5500788.1 hypothetical protein TVAGG3_0862630 [Trichomonas vaginalis G3]|eukprot:XP_001324593.1 hypothetical protein [Trichomonas vaginalis G3]
MTGYYNNKIEGKEELVRKVLDSTSKTTATVVADHWILIISVSWIFVCIVIFYLGIHICNRCCPCNKEFIEDESKAYNKISNEQLEHVIANQ